MHETKFRPIDRSIIFEGFQYISISKSASYSENWEFYLGVEDLRIEIKEEALGTIFSGCDKNTKIHSN